MTQLSIQVRRYVPRDLDAVKDLIEDLARLYGDDYNDYLFQSQMQVRALDASAGTFVAICENDIRGVAFADTERDPGGVLHGRISNVDVAEEWQGRGIGNALIDEVIQFLNALGVPIIWANVNPNNTAMVHMFEQRDFTRILKVMEKYVDPLTPTGPLELCQGEILYRPVVQKDLPAVKGLIHKLATLFHEDFSAYWFDLYSQKFFQDPASQIFVADVGETVAGMAFAEVRRDPAGYAYGYISNIMVAEHARGQGIGSHLLNVATNFLSHLNIPKIWANVNHDSALMQEMFEAQGFKHKFTVLELKLNLGCAC